MTTIALIQARMNSARLPGKVLEPLGPRAVLGWVVDAARNIAGVDKVLVATSDQDADTPVADWCVVNNVDYIRGPLDDVLARFIAAIDRTGAETVIRLTADCPLLDPEVCGQVLQLYLQTGCDFATNADSGTWPDGMDCEVIRASALRIAAEEADRSVQREHVTPFITARRDRFELRSLVCSIPGLGRHRWTLDEPEDLEFLRRLVAKLPSQDHPPGMSRILSVLRDNPDLAAYRNPHARNAGYRGVLPQNRDERYRRFDRSKQMLSRALEVTPTASQTFSKSYLQYPDGHAPAFLTHGMGGRVWDIDGHEYVDLVCGLLSVMLGYRDRDVDDAIRAQMSRGISFSLPTRLESELAERLVDIIPSAEMVRFGKNGTDATSAAVRMARAYTGRDRVIVCGYHGWQDWYIGSTARNKGVPGAVSKLTHSVGYNDLPGIEALFSAHPGEIAAIVMEPITFDEPLLGYLEGIQKLARKERAVLVFDETVTGFRFGRGGAQESLGIVPDLSCFGKGMGNGMPISAVMGRRDIMSEMEHIFFSGTFGGEALSLAAALAVLDKLDREPVRERLEDLGLRFSARLEAAIARNRLGDVMEVKGRAPWRILNVKDHPSARKEAIRTLLIREMLAGGVITLGTHNVCYAHTDSDIAAVGDAYDVALDLVARELSTGDLEGRLGHPAIVPIFQVRKGPKG